MNNITEQANCVYNSLSKYSHLLSINNVKTKVESDIEQWKKEVSRLFIMDSPHWQTEQDFKELSEHKGDLISYK